MAKINKEAVGEALYKIIADLVEESAGIAEFEEDLSDIRSDLSHKFDYELEEKVDDYLQSISSLDVKKLSAFSERLDKIEERFAKIEKFVEQAETVSRFLADARLINSSK